MTHTLVYTKLGAELVLPIGPMYLSRAGGECWVRLVGDECDWQITGEEYERLRVYQLRVYTEGGN